MKPVIYFIRHGQTDWNAERRFQGQHDIPLNDTGRAQAKRNGEVLKDLIDPTDFYFLASPLSRTRETMEIARTAMGLAPGAYATDEILVELSFGKWEGQTADDLAVQEPDLWQKRAENKWYFNDHGGESYEDLAQRITPWYEAVDRPMVVVSHGGVNRALRAIACNMNRDELANEEVPQDKILVLEGRETHWV